MKIGITGSLASGKTTVTKLIAKEKFPIFNADLIVKNLYKNKSFVRKLSKKFKIKVKKNFKKVISKMIANKEIELKNLEKIIHPIVRKNMVSFANQNKKRKNVLFEIPLLIESKLENFFDLVILVGASKKIRLKIDNEIYYDNLEKEGQLDILFVNKNTSLKYQITKDSFSFTSEGNKNFYEGIIDFKPFYLNAKFNYEGLSSKNLFDDNSIIIDLINSEILNNKNLSAKINLDVKDITNINELNNLRLKLSIEEGSIGFADSTIMWKNDLKITLDETFLTIEDDGINLIGTIFLDFKNIDNFYSSFQLQKKDRKNLDKIQIDYVYNLNDHTLRLDNPRIDNKQNIQLEEFLNTFNSKKDRGFNKITFKNFINNFFRAYAG